MRDTPTNHATRSDRQHGGRRRRALTLGFGLIALVAGIVAPAGAFAATPAVAATDGSTTAACTGGPWPWTVQGAPAFTAGSAAGERLWHSSTGWHLRVTHPGTSLVWFSGTIRANRPLHVTGYRQEPGDTFTLSADRLSVTYHFKNFGRLDGLDFTTECATRLSVGARMNGAVLPVRRIWVGRAGHHPLQNPFVILRRA
jgi:hypothetical protein